MFARLTRHNAAKVMKAVVILTSAALLAACAAKPKVSNKWIDKSNGNLPFDKVLVVGVTANTDRRISFESSVAEDLFSERTAVWTSISLMPADQEINEGSLRTVANTQGANGIVVTRVIDLKIEPVEIGGRSTVLAEEHQSGFDHTYRRKQGTLFQYDYEEDVEATYITSEYTTKLQTDVYDAVSGDRVYTMTSAISKQETLADVIKVLSDEIAKRLRRDKVIQQ